MNRIKGYEDFIRELHTAGMSMGGDNSEGIFTLCDSFEDNIKWHTDDPETDPWTWRMRVLNEYRDIAYGKFFFRKSGYITRQWFPLFYAVRRSGLSLEDAYREGNISHEARQIYQLIEEHQELPLHLIKKYGNFTREDKSRFDRAITQLQMDFYINMCGQTRKTSTKGEEYGWSSTVFCLTEDFFDESVLSLSEKTTPQEAYRVLDEHILMLNPQATPAKRKKFILGK